RSAGDSTDPADGHGHGHGATAGGGQDRNGGSVAAAGAAGGRSDQHGLLVVLVWVGGLVLAVWLGGLLGVGAHLLSARRTTTHGGPRGHS
ncbi:peptidase S8, partial [Frankia sp. AiPs1]|nr:peptidase S8 [Frankia sp. AiPs1]